MRRPLAYETRIVLTAALALAPVAIAAVLFAFSDGVSPRARWTTLFFIAVAAFVVTFIVREQIVYPLRTVANLLTALREENYSLRARRGTDDSIGELIVEINALASMLQSRKLEAVEAAALLRAVMAEIDAAIFTFDEAGRLQLVNRAAKTLLALPRERLLGRSAAELGLAELVADDAPAAVDRTFPSGAGRWSIRRSVFREKGLPHRLLVIADITRALRDEETRAWQRIVRVLGHELNNSLTPIKSIGTSIETLVTREPLPRDWREDVVRGARVIATRAESLTRFTSAYTQLARLPPPARKPIAAAELIARVVAIEPRMQVEIAPGADVAIAGDDAQIEQMLINLLRNAVDASLETGGGVRIEWNDTRDAVVVHILDEGAGVSSTANLFVPFFTTKANGTGIGLVLSRQIAEAHGGSVTLENRRDRRGSVATVTLPRVNARASSPSARE
jgi:two-component system, NtrC family, nitrogen regulation sensor histidine kinase NtrY